MDGGWPFPIIRIRFQTGDPPRSNFMKSATSSPVTRRSLFSWVRSSNLKLQLLLVLVILITVFTRVLPLEMQKRIVNETIKFRDFNLLMVYSGIYLAAIVMASGLKFLINYLQVKIGQKALADMRIALYRHILTLPLGFFRKTQPGMVVSSLVSEIASAGDFVGTAVAVPVTSLLTLLAFAGYLLSLNPLLAVISMSVYPLVSIIVPWLQQKTNQANKQRVDQTRIISSQIGETIDGIQEIQANGAFGIEGRKFDRTVTALMKTRITWNLYRFSVKITNNFFNNLSPFLIFIVGGYLAMNGRLGLGSMVAFLSAQEKIYDPWKELIDFYQSYQDSKVRYKRIMEYFDAEPDYLLAPVDRAPYRLGVPTLEVRDLTFATDQGIRLIDRISFTLKPGEHLALVGFSGSGKSTLALCIGQLYKYNHGQVLMNNLKVAELTKKDMVLNLGFIPQNPYIFSGTIEENLLYACLARDESDTPEQNDKQPSLDDIIAMLHQTGLFIDVLQFGLNTVIDSERDKELAATLVRVRKNFQQEFGEELAAHVEFFDENRYLRYSSVAENLTFGSADKIAFKNDNLAQNAYFLDFLNKADLTRPLLALGIQLTRQTVDILGDLPPDEIFFKQSPIAPNDLDLYREIIGRLKTNRLHQLGEKDQSKLLELALRYTPGRHKMVALADMLEALILEGRAMFREEIIRDRPNAFSFFQALTYIDSQNILNNILFGKTTGSSHRVQDKINQRIIQLLIQEDLLETVTRIGMQVQVGSKGDRLSGGQKQKLAIARVLLKSPVLLIMDEATSALDQKSQARIQNLLTSRWKGKSTVVSVVHRLDIISSYDKVAVMKAGRLMEMGTYQELINKKGTLYELMGKK